jgi:hypothetical protein
MDNIEKEFQMSSIKIRNEYKGAIDSNKSEFIKSLREIEKLDQQIKKEKLIDKTTDPDFENESLKYQYLNKRLQSQNTNLTHASTTANDITTSQTRTLEELYRQKKKLISTNETVTEIEKTLSLHDQIFQVMNNRELFNKFKLVLIAALLFLANFIVIYIKFF